MGKTINLQFTEQIEQMDNKQVISLVIIMMQIKTKIKFNVSIGSTLRAGQNVVKRDGQTLLVYAKQLDNLHKVFNMFVLFYLIILLIRIQHKK